MATHGRGDNLAVSVRGLSKSYTIRHNAAPGGGAAGPLGRLARAFARPGTETFWALKDVSFDIPAGEVVGIVGRNGAGKSTLLKVLSRITEPTTGHIDLWGRVGSLLEVGTGFHPELTGRENVYLNGAILGMSRREIERQFDAIVDFSGTERFLDTPVKRYSSGMYVRLAFAVAAHLNPEILIVDEVLAVGDMDFQKKCLGKMDDVARSGRTVLIVSHNMSVVNGLCRHGIFLEGGRVKAQGDIHEIVTLYLDQILKTDDLPLDALRYNGVPDMGKLIRFTRLALVSDGDGGKVRLNDPIVVEMEVESDVDQDGLTVSAGVNNDMGNCVGTLFAREPFALRRGERKTLRLTLSEANLAPGSYYVAISVGSGGFETTRRDFDIIVGKPTFEVLPFSQGEEAVSEWIPSWGSIVFRKARLEPAP